MKKAILALSIVLLSVSAFGAPDQYDYEHPINISDLEIENGELIQIQDQDYSEHLYGMKIIQESTCEPLIVSGKLEAPEAVSKVSISGREVARPNSTYGNIEISFNDEIKSQAVQGNREKLVRQSDGSTEPNSPQTASYQVEKYDWAEILGTVKNRHYKFSFNPVENENSFRISSKKVRENCESVSRNLSLTFRTYKFWHDFRINSIDMPENLSKGKRFDISVNVTNPGNRPTGILLDEPHSIQARFTGLTYPIGSSTKELNLSAGETRIVTIPFSVPANSDDTRLTNRVDIEKKEPMAIQISNKRATIVEKQTNLSVEDGREPLENITFRVKPENPFPGETFKIEVLTPDREPITPEGKIEFIKNGETLEEWETSRLSTTTSFPSWNDLNRTDLDNITVKVTLNELNGKISESKTIGISESKLGWLSSAYDLLISGNWFIFG